MEIAMYLDGKNLKILTVYEDQIYYVKPRCKMYLISKIKLSCSPEQLGYQLIGKATLENNLLPHQLFQSLRNTQEFKALHRTDQQKILRTLLVSQQDFHKKRKFIDNDVETKQDSLYFTLQKYPLSFVSFLKNKKAAQTLDYLQTAADEFVQGVQQQTNSKWVMLNQCLFGDWLSCRDFLQLRNVCRTTSQFIRPSSYSDCFVGPYSPKFVQAIQGSSFKVKTVKIQLGGFQNIAKKKQESNIEKWLKREKTNFNIKQVEITCFKSKNKKYDFGCRKLPPGVETLIANEMSLPQIAGLLRGKKLQKLETFGYSISGDFNLEFFSFSVKHWKHVITESKHMNIWIHCHIRDLEIFEIYSDCVFSSFNKPNQLLESVRCPKVILNFPECGFEFICSTNDICSSVKNLTIRCTSVRMRSNFTPLMKNFPNLETLSIDFAFGDYCDDIDVNDHQDLQKMNFLQKYSIEFFNRTTPIYWDRNK